MKLAVGSDERTHLTDVVIEVFREKGHQLTLFGPLKDEELPWPVVAQQLAESVVSGETQEGILFCWTGTGASIAANKVSGIRAALVGDAETAKGARRWNNANVLVMSLRATSKAIAEEIIDAWFQEHMRPEEQACIELVTEIERKYARTPE